MGNTNRAELFSNELALNGDTWVKRWLFQIFDKCGNCNFRLICWKPIIDAEGNAVEVYKSIYDCNGKKRKTLQPNHPTKFDGKQAAKLVTHCSGCVQLRHCVYNVIMSGTFLGLAEATGTDIEPHMLAIQRCAKCPNIEPCYTGVMKELGFSWSSKLKVLGVFAKCKMYGRGK